MSALLLLQYIPCSSQKCNLTLKKASIMALSFMHTLRILFFQLASEPVNHRPFEVAPTFQFIFLCRRPSCLWRNRAAKKKPVILRIVTNSIISLCYPLVLAIPHNVHVFHAHSNRVKHEVSMKLSCSP